MKPEIACDQFSPDEWREMASSFADNTIYQTWGFGDLRARETSTKVSRLAVLLGETVLGLAQVRIKRIPMSRAGIAYVYWGPLWRRSQESGATNLRAVLEGIHSEYAVRRGLAVRLVPRLAEDLSAAEEMQAFAQAGFVRDSSNAYETILLDLSPDGSELRAGLCRKWRNHLSQSEKGSVEVRVCSDEASMERIESLYAEMWEKKQFETGVSVQSFRRLQEMLHESERPIVLLAYSEGEAIAGHVLSLLGDTGVNLLSASIDRGRKLKASYLLLWRAIETAKRAGARWYDLGGIDREKNPGVYSFKSGVRGAECVFAGQFDACCAGSSRLLVPWAERAHKALRFIRRGNVASSK